MLGASYAAGCGLERKCQTDLRALVKRVAADRMKPVYLPDAGWWNIVVLCGTCARQFGP